MYFCRSKLLCIFHPPVYRMYQIWNVDYVDHSVWYTLVLVNTSWMTNGLSHILMQLKEVDPISYTYQLVPWFIMRIKNCIYDPIYCIDNQNVYSVLSFQVVLSDVCFEWCLVTDHRLHFSDRCVSVSFSGNTCIIRIKFCATDF